MNLMVVMMHEECQIRQEVEYNRQLEDFVFSVCKDCISWDLESIIKKVQSGLTPEIIIEFDILELLIDKNEDHILTFLLSFYENVDFELEDEYKLYIDKIKKKLLIFNNNLT